MRRSRGIPADAVLSRGISRHMFTPRTFVGTRPDDDGLCWREDCGRPHHEHTGPDHRCPTAAERR
jgi:hypothetical protein